MKMMILALQPHMHQEGILSGDMKEHQLKAIVGAGKKNIHRKPAECVQ
jgi:hypothetical protein